MTSTRRGKHVLPQRYRRSTFPTAAHAASQGSITHWDECASRPRHLWLASVALIDRLDRVIPSLSPGEHRSLSSQPLTDFRLCIVKQKQVIQHRQNVGLTYKRTTSSTVSNSVDSLLQRTKRTHYKYVCYEIKAIIQRLMLGGKTPNHFILLTHFNPSRRYGLSEYLFPLH